jgi:hypothetical protein
MGVPAVPMKTLDILENIDIIKIIKIGFKSSLFFLVPLSAGVQLFSWLA